MMEKVTTKRMSLYSGRTHPALALEVAEHLGVEMGHPNLVEFALGSHPKESTPAPGTLVRNGSTLEFTYWRSKAALIETAPDTFHAVEIKSGETIAMSRWLPLQRVRLDLPSVPVKKFL
jgi:hypothetical protein